MRDELGSLPRENEPRRRLFPPGAHSIERRCAVKRAIDLGGRKPLGVPLESVLSCQIVRIKRPLPAAVSPPGCADPKIAHGLNWPIVYTDGQANGTRFA